jgi:DNA replication protein DnaC
MKNISLANNPFAKTPSTKPVISRNKKVICSQKSVVNNTFKDWPEIFNNDSTLTSAILDRLLHHAETVIIEGKSFRMKDSLPQ